MYRFLIFLTSTLLLLSCSAKKKEVTPVYKKITEAVYASGNIYPKNDYQVFANADGFLIDLLVSEGSLVTVGHPLFRIESDIQDVRYETSYDVYQKALENYSENSPALKEIRTGIETARIKMLNDSINYVRYQSLKENDATSEVDFERARLSYQQSQNDYNARMSNYNRVRNQLYVEMKNAESQYKINLKDKSNYIVKSFIDGMVYDVYKKRGEAVRKNDAIALIGDSKDVYLKLMVDELDITKVQLGQQVYIKVDVYKDKIFTAKVIKIYPKLNKADQSFRVDAEFVGEKPPVLYGLTVEANIVIAVKDKALTIPREFLTGEDSVWVMEDSEEKRIKITKGLEDFDQVEVTSGLTDKSVLIRK